jgi:hypothetical protein
VKRVTPWLSSLLAVAGKNTTPLVLGLKGNS